MEFITKYFTALALVIILPFSISRAQNNDESNPLEKGSNAFQFQISDNFTLGSFSGSTISYKRQLTKDHARRIGLSINNSYSWNNYPDSENEEERSELNLNFGISYTWMNYTNPESDIKFYYGYGPGVRTGFGRFVEEQTGLKTINQDSFYAISGIGYAGVEWFFQSSMSLHAEYRAFLQVNHRRDKITHIYNGNRDTNRSHSTMIILGGNDVKFGLSVYF